MARSDVRKTRKASRAWRREREARGWVFHEDGTRLPDGRKLTPGDQYTVRDVNEEGRDRLPRYRCINIRTRPDGVTEVTGWGGPGTDPDGPRGMRTVTAGQVDTVHRKPRRTL